MAEIARWNGHKFVVDSKTIRSFTELQIKGSCETEQNEDGDKVEKRKGSLPAEISLTVNLHAMVGVDVRNEAMSYVDQAAAGAKDYIYVGQYKLVPHKMMLTEATVAEIQIAHNGTWISAIVMLILKQCQVDSGSSSTPTNVAGQSNNTGFPEKQSVNSSTTTTTTTQQTTTTSSQTHLQEAQASINNIVNNGRNASK